MAVGGRARAAPPLRRVSRTSGRPRRAKLGSLPVVAEGINDLPEVLALQPLLLLLGAARGRRRRCCRIDRDRAQTPGGELHFHLPAPAAATAASAAATTSPAALGQLRGRQRRAPPSLHRRRGPQPDSLPCTPGDARLLRGACITLASVHTSPSQRCWRTHRLTWPPWTVGGTLLQPLSSFLSRPCLPPSLPDTVSCTGPCTSLRSLKSDCTPLCKYFYLRIHSFAFGHYSTSYFEYFLGQAICEMFIHSLTS